MYLLMKEDKAIYEFTIDNQSNEVNYVSKLRCDLDICDMNEFLELREIDNGLLEKHDRSMESINCISREMCTKRALSLITNYTSKYDTLWVKDSESITNYKTARKRLTNCFIEDWSGRNIFRTDIGASLMGVCDSKNTLAVHCNSRTTSREFEHLLTLKVTLLFFIVDKEIKYFKSNKFMDITEKLKLRKESPKVYVYIDNYSGFHFKQTAFTDPDSGNVQKPNKLYLSRISDCLNVCDFYVDDRSKNIVLGTIHDASEYNLFKSKFGSIANYYSVEVNKESRSIEENLLNREIERWKVHE